MFAVLKTGGKQYRVRKGDVLRVERLAAEAGETVQFNEILVLGGDSPVVGAPLVEDAAVQARVIDQIRGDKVIHYVRRRRKHSSQRTRGHRQYLTLLRITDILASGADGTGVKAAIGSGQYKPAAEAAEDAPAEAAKPKAKKAAAKENEAKHAEPKTAEPTAKTPAEATAEASPGAKPKNRAAKKPAAEAQE